MFSMCLIAYLHPANHHPIRASNYNKPEYNNEINIPSSLDKFNEERSILGEKSKTPYD